MPRRPATALDGVTVTPRAGRRALPRSSAVHDDDPPAAAAVISAAVVAMAENGFHGTSVRDIAELAGVSSAAIYHYFTSKQHLLEVIMMRGTEHIHAQTEAALLAAPANPADRLRAIVGVHVARHLSAQREAFVGNTELRALDSAARRRVVAHRDLQQRLFDSVVDDGAASGVFTTPYPHDAARAVVTMCSAVASWYRTRGDLGPEEVTARYQEMSLALVGCRPAQSRARRPTKET